jgi:transposase-like protein
MRGRSHSREFKLLIVRQLASGEKRSAQVCREHNLAASLVARWRQEYDTRGEARLRHLSPRLPKHWKPKSRSATHRV